MSPIFFSKDRDNKVMQGGTFVPLFFFRKKPESRWNFLKVDSFQGPWMTHESHDSDRLKPTFISIVVDLQYPYHPCMVYLPTFG